MSNRVYDQGEGSYRKLGGQVVICVGVGADNLLPLVDIGLFYLPRPGWSNAHPSPTPLQCV